MNISFIALNISGAETVQYAADKLRGVLSGYGRCDFKLCGSMSQVSASLGDAFANAETIVVGIEPSAYCKSKLAILRAMHIKTQLNDEIKAKLPENTDMTAYQLSMHCAMPVNAEVFASADGLYSGFALQSGKQHFIMLTLDKLRLEPAVSQGLVPYLEKFAPTEQEKNEVAPDSSLAVKAAERLRECGKKVHFAATPSCEMVKELCAEQIKEGTILFSDYTSERGSEAPRSYIADLARYAIPEGSSDFGAAVSNVFTGTSQETGEQKYNIYVAVADVSASRVLRFASQPGETPEELITAAIEMLMEMICDKCDELSASPEEEAAVPFTAEPIEEIEEPAPEEKTKKKHRGIRTAVYVLLAIVLAVIVYFGYNGFENANQNRADAIGVFTQYVSGAADNSGSALFFDEDLEYVTFEEETSENPEEPSGELISELNPTTTAATTENIESTTDKTTTTTKEETTTRLTTTAKPTTTAKTTTTAKPTTTAKATTTAKPTTTKKQEADTGEYEGEFVFTVYGYGHGVGMSQEGALGYSKQGMSYSEILAHYYPGTTFVASDPDMPQTVRFGGVDYELVEYLCRSVAAEIGTGCNSSTQEAYKAQAVAIYTYAKRYGFNLKSSLHAFNKTYNYAGTALEAAVKTVVGQYVSYNGKPAMTTYYAMSAGKTTKASTVWSGDTYPYLETAVESTPDKNCAKYKTTYTISANDFKALMKKNLGVDLTGDPSGWIKIVSHDSAVSSSIGYVEKMTVGSKTISGAAFRGTAMAYKIRSHCFTVSYTK